jgi:hypothetical protein
MKVSKYYGVHWDDCNKEWTAVLPLCGNAIILGFHATQEEAAKAYDLAATSYYGVDATLNIDSYNLDNKVERKAIL